MAGSKIFGLDREAIEHTAVQQAVSFVIKDLSTTFAIYIAYPAELKVGKLLGSQAQKWLKLEGVGDWSIPLPLQIPINPAKIKINSPSGNTTVNLVNTGEVSLIRLPKLFTISWDAWFPAGDWMPCTQKGVTTFNSIMKPGMWKSFINIIRQSRIPCRLVIPEMGINNEVTIETFDWDHHDGAYEDLYYSISFKEYRTYGANKVGTELPQQYDENGNPVSQSNSVETLANPGGNVSQQINGAELGQNELDVQDTPQQPTAGCRGTYVLSSEDDTSIISYAPTDVPDIQLVGYSNNLSSVRSGVVSMQYPSEKTFVVSFDDTDSVYTATVNSMVQSGVVVNTSEDEWGVYAAAQGRALSGKQNTTDTAIRQALCWVNQQKQSKVIELSATQWEISH